ncbi:MAG: peroxiredoxin family protein [Candidatus Acidiferrales bacterium]
MEALSAGTAAPPFTLKDTGGQNRSLAEALKRGPVLLAFFKNSCPVCQFTFPFLERLYQGIKGQDGLTLWGVSQDDARDTLDFAREFGTSFPLLPDEDGYPVSNAYGLTNVPTLFLVKPDGQIQLTSVGFERRDIERVAGEFARVAGQPIQVFQPGENVPDSKAG